MAGSTHAEQAERDDAHLRSLGIKPELQRSLGLLSNFAVAFSYISVSTGTFTNQAVAFGVGGPPIFWAWPLVILGQTFVALNFAELASHFPVAGSIYQWSKRLSNKTLGWFTGWIYFWAGVVTVTAVAATVPLVLSAIWLSGLVGAIFLLAVTLSFKDVNAAVDTGQAAGFPIADTIKDNLTTTLVGNFTLGELYLVMILVAVYVCTLAIQGATVRLMFSMGRDRRLPFGALWGHVSPSFKTPLNSAV